MFRLRSSNSLLMAGALLAILFAGFWHEISPSVEADSTAKQTLVASATHQTETTDATKSSLAHASFSGSSKQSTGIASPFASSAESPLSTTTTTAQRARQQFEQSLRDYSQAGLSPEQKIRIKQSLHNFKRDPQLRALILETFFSTAEPQLAQTLYELMLAADLKDVGLLEQLIERDSRTPNIAATSSSPTKARILDLIADLGTNQQAGYSVVIDGYLAQIGNHAEAQLRASAAAQRIWYLNQHQPYNLAAQEKYLVDSAPVVRQEVYSLIEARLANQTLSGQTQLASALNAVLQADYLAASAEEKSRITALLAALKDGKLAL